MFVIRNDKGQFYSVAIDSEWGDGWGNDAKIFSSYEDARSVVTYLTEGHPDSVDWIREVMLLEVCRG